jgi:hypothetical protein
MSRPSIEITYRAGKMIAAYISLGGASSARCSSTREMAPGMVIDFARDGRAIGLELALPKSATLVGVNRVLRSVGAAPLRRTDFAPLRVA